MLGLCLCGLVRLVKCEFVLGVDCDFVCFVAFVLKFNVVC